MSALEKHPGQFPMDHIELTRMRRRHLRKVLAIEGRVYPRPWSMGLFLSEISQKNARSYLVARHEGEVVGYCGMMLLLGEAHITNIAVDPDFHGRKIGSRLLLAQMTEAIARGCDTVSLEVRVTNKPAQAMYEKFGFHVTGLRKGYYIETKEDALVMEASDALSNAMRLRLRAIRNELEGAIG